MFIFYTCMLLNNTNKINSDPLEYRKKEYLKTSKATFCEANCNCLVKI